MNLNKDDFCYWRQHANQTLNWFQTDSEQLYQENLINKNEKLKKWGWINNSFTYKFNSHGFRCEEFTDADSILFLGCSVTLGVGLPITATFPTLLANELNLQCVNLGVGGSSTDTAFRIAYTYLEKIRPKIVVATFLFPERTELLSYTGAIPLNPGMLNQKSLDKITRRYVFEYYEKYLEVPETAQVNLLKNTLAINKLCDQYNIKFISQTSHPNYLKFFNQARDLVHPGTEYHAALFRHFLNKF